MAAGVKTGGRKAGTPNKTTAFLKDATLKAASLAGGSDDEDGLVTYLEKQARDNPNAFLTLLGKVMPLQVNANIDGQMSVIFKTVYENK